MIDITDVQKVLNDVPNENTICHEYELRPTIIVSDIKKLANITDDYGYIFNGVLKTNDRYIIKGLSNGYTIKNTVEKALGLLTVKPDIEYGSVVINGKTIYVMKVFRINEGTSLLSDELESESIKKFVETLYKICIKLQGNSKYIDASEDERNDYIRDMLDREEEYVIKDQTRRGLSASGASAGEIDILVEKDSYPFTVVEALILKSLNKDYLGKHLDKIYTYDTTGNLFNVCLVYAECKKFASFWEKYCDFVEQYNYPYPLITSDENIDQEYTGSEIRIMITTHNRSGKQTKLYHICVKILSK
ncbi:hypothetical protein [uncultured Ruminococcus sp.]|jgi:hypothetical protein|uniref:hypothetical protein n=1 Tax=uncultured Ruminococcus sp. TaxID=165186 RepID=UPI0026750896|nr:hypothetical protein [uncultured Ruminococcus sp.]